MIVALLTDFGTRDHFVASVKGTILSAAPAATVVDITHEIEPQNIDEAAFTLGACYRDFPAGTIFLAVVDPGVGSARRPVAVRCDDRTFICPDNGIMSFVLEYSGEYNAFEIENSEFGSTNISATFHGRDIFAPAAARIANGLDPGSLGRRVTDLCILETAKAVHEGNRTAGVIVHIDRFGNLITNLMPDDIPGQFSIEINDRYVSQLRSFYAQAAPGEIFAIVGSTGRIEISIYGGSAKDLLGAAPGQRITVTNLSEGD